MRSRVVLLLALGALSAPVAAAPDPQHGLAARVDQKLQAIVARSLVTSATAEPVTTTFTQDEINAYLSALGDLPSGLRQPSVRLLDAGGLDVRALVDLDAVRDSQDRGWLDPFKYVSGMLNVQAIGSLRGTRGQGVFRLESAKVGGAPVPKALLQELLVYYTRSPELPNGLKLDTPFDLPASIREVDVRLGLATVIQ